MDVNKLYPRIKYAEWIAITVSAIFQLTWAWTSGSLDSLHLSSLAFLAVLFVIAAVSVEKLNMNQRTALVVSECILATVAMCLGSYRMYGLLFLVLAGKIATLLDKGRMLAVSIFLVVIHGAATAYLRTHSQPLHGVLISAVLGFERHPNALVLFESQLFFICAMVIAILFGRAILAESASRRAAERLSREIEEMAVAVERSRIARDMHDSIGHSLTSLNIQLELTSKLIAAGDIAQAEQALTVARDAAKTSLAEVRNTVRSIREEEFGLQQSVEAITDRISAQQNITFEVNIDDGNISSPCRHNLLMILQECLTNVQKHSQASKVAIVLNTSNREAHLSVVDNGTGFVSASRSNFTGCGIKGMEERALSLGGAVNIQSKPGDGTSVNVTLPI